MMVISVHPIRGPLYFFAVGDVENALGLEDGEFEKHYGINKPALDTDIVFNCRSGIRSLVALGTSYKLGYSKYVKEIDLSVPQADILSATPN